MLVRVRALLAAMLLLATGCTTNSAGAPPPVARAPEIEVASAGDAVPADRWRAVLIAGDNNSPAFDNGVEALRDKLAGRGVRNISALTSDPAAQPVAPGRHRGQCVERAAQRRRRGLPGLHHQPRRRERCASCGPPRAWSSRPPRQRPRCGVRQAAHRRDRVGLPQRHLSHARHAPAQPRRAHRGRGGARELRLRRRRSVHLLRPVPAAAVRRRHDLARALAAADARLRGEPRATHGREAAARSRRSSSAPPSPTSGFPDVPLAGPRRAAGITIDHDPSLGP